jgi:hypothetical protein
MLIGAVVGCDSWNDTCTNGVCSYLLSGEGYGCLCSPGYGPSSTVSIADCSNSLCLLHKDALCDKKISKSS